MFLMSFRIFNKIESLFACYARTARLIVCHPRCVCSALLLKDTSRSLAIILVVGRAAPRENLAREKSWRTRENIPIRERAERALADLDRPKEIKLW